MAGPGPTRSICQTLPETKRVPLDQVLRTQVKLICLPPKSLMMIFWPSSLQILLVSNLTQSPQLPSEAWAWQSMIYHDAKFYIIVTVPENLYAKAASKAGQLRLIEIKIHELAFQWLPHTEALLNLQSAKSMDAVPAWLCLPHITQSRCVYRRHK